MIDAITIDGPAASGKSTLGMRLAKHLGYLFFDTGVMYRAVTLAVLAQGLSVMDEAACTKAAEETQIDVAPPTKDDGRLNDVLVDGVDQTWGIRQAEVDANVSPVSAYPGVRQALTEQQRRIGLRGKVVLVGRDTGTVVLPEAPLKIYLDASVEERARRRYDECIARGDEVSYEEILEAMRERDRIDSSRDVAPLKAADDAVILDSDELDAHQVFEQALHLVENRLK
jgi:cytidylate kinase